MERNCHDSWLPRLPPYKHKIHLGWRARSGSPLRPPFEENSEENGILSILENLNIQKYTDVYLNALNDQKLPLDKLAV